MRAFAVMITVEVHFRVLKGILASRNADRMWNESLVHQVPHL
jgi:hypothetical protein